MAKASASPELSAARLPEEGRGDGSAAVSRSSASTSATVESGQAAPLPGQGAERRRNRLGTISLGVAIAGAAGARLALAFEPLADDTWLRILAAGFEAAVVGGLADWFAVTALFRRPLNLPIPHTDIIRTNRKKLIDGIVDTVERDWLSPDVIGAQIRRFRPSTIVVEWLDDPEHVARLGGPLRSFLRAVARLIDDPEVAGFLQTTITRQLDAIPADPSLGEWLERATASPSFETVVRSLLESLVRFAERPDAAETLQRLFANVTPRERRMLLAILLRRRLFWRKLVEVSVPVLRDAAEDPAHPLRRSLRDAILRFAARLRAGDAAAFDQLERVRKAVLESLEAGPLVRDALARLRGQLERDLDDPTSSLSKLVDGKLHAGVLELLGDPARRDAFDRWVHSTADDLLRRHHHEIGRTVRENLETRDPEMLVQQIEERVGPDLQFIRLNGALVGGMIGLALAVAHWLVG